MKEAQSERERRCKLLYIPARVILAMLRGICVDLKQMDVVRLPDFSGVIPDGALVEAVHYDFTRAAFAFRFRHPDFDVVAECSELPTLGLLTGLQYRIFIIQYKNGAAFLNPERVTVPTQKEVIVPTQKEVMTDAKDGDTNLDSV